MGIDFVWSDEKVLEIDMVMIVKHYVLELMTLNYIHLKLLKLQILCYITEKKPQKG